MGDGLLSLAAGLRAVACLAPGDDDATAAVLALLRGHGPAAGVRPASRRAAEAASPPATPRPTSTDAALPPAPPPVPPPRQPRPGRGGATQATPLRSRPLAASAAPPVSVRSLPAAAPISPPPIVLPGRARALLSPLAATPAEGPEIDIDRLVALVAAQRPLPGLPRLPVWSLRRGAQLLIDVSAALTPLRSDVAQVQQALQRVVGVDRLAVAAFAGVPTWRCGSGPRAQWQAWQPPARGMPVIVLSDLGCVGPVLNRDWGTPEDWVAFARRARAAGCPVLALTPFPARRIHPRIAREVTLLPWTEWLDAGRVRRVLRDAGRRPAADRP